jgi:hypothetical protein
MTFSRHTDTNTAIGWSAFSLPLERCAYENGATFSARSHVVILAINIDVNISPHSVIMKEPLVQYYLHQAGRGGSANGIGTIYAVQPFIQHGHGIGSF